MGSSPSGELIIRADASPQIGTGHVMRCLALAQAWQDAGGTALFAAASMPPALAERLQQEGLSVASLEVQPGSAEDAQQIAALAQEVSATWVVVDGYSFGAAYQHTIKGAGLQLLFVDDCGHAEHYWADIVLNQNLHADESLYRDREDYTRLLLGTRYALLRREFWPWRGWRREIPEVARKVLVTLGGSDPDNQTLKVIQALQEVAIDGFEAAVVVGPVNPHFEELESAADHLPVAIRLVRNVSDMPELMAWADMAVSASGSTCWELALLCTPSLLLVLADNQEPIAKKLAGLGAAVNLGRPGFLSPKDIALALVELATAHGERAAMARCEQELVDGDGAARVVRQMRAYGLTLRPVQSHDCRLLWQWANDPQTRAVSFTTEHIPWERHVAWFTTRLADPNTLFYIACDSASKPVGQIRYQMQGQEAVISISIAPDERGKGYGSQLIQLGAQAVFSGTPVNVIHAYIRPDNVVSTRAFAAAGFVSNSATEIHSQRACHFVLHKERHDEQLS